MKNHKTNTIKKQIDILRKKIAPLRNRINELDRTERLNVQVPRIRKMIGYCLRSIYEPKMLYGKILDLVEDIDGYPDFILEEINITNDGNPHIQLNYVSPYLNEQWRDAEIPMSGWEKCSEDEYETFKAKVLNEICTQKSLRKFLKKRK